MTNRDIDPTFWENWDRTFRNTMDDLRIKGPSEWSAHCDLMAVLLWLALRVKQSEAEDPPGEGLPKLWQALPSAALPELRSKFKEAVAIAARGKASIGEAIELLEKESLRQIGDREIASALAYIAFIPVRLEPDFRNRVGDTVWTMWSSLRGGWAEAWSPEALARLLVGIGRPTASDRVYDPFAGFGGFLLEAWKAGTQNLLAPYPTLTGSELNGATWARACLLFEIYGVAIDMRMEDVFAFRPPVEAPTLVLSDPPIGIRIREGSPMARLAQDNVPDSLAFSFLAIQQILADLTPTRGRAILVVPPRLLFGGGSVARVRQEWLQNDWLEAVITLPRGLFLPRTQLPLSLVVFNLSKTTPRQEKILLIDGEELGRPDPNARFSVKDFEAEAPRILEAYHTFRAQPRFAVIVDQAELASHDWDLSPRGYLTKPSETYHRPDLDGLLAQVAQLEHEADQANTRFLIAAERLNQIISRPTKAFPP